MNGNAIIVIVFNRANSLSVVDSANFFVVEIDEFIKVDNTGILEVDEWGSLHNEHHRWTRVSDLRCLLNEFEANIVIILDRFHAGKKIGISEFI